MPMKPADELRAWIKCHPHAPGLWLEAVEALEAAGAQEDCNQLSSIVAQFAKRGVDFQKVQAVAMRAYAEAWQDVAREPAGQEVAALRAVRHKANELLATLQDAERLRRQIFPLEGQAGFVAWTDQSAERLRDDPDENMGARVSLPDVLRDLRAECARLLRKPARRVGAIRDLTEAARAVFVVRAALRFQRDYGTRMPTPLADLANALFPSAERPMTAKEVTLILDRGTRKKSKPR